MSSPLPPDPYAALGVPKNADAATIKSTYRKLALKCHPDKVTDESLKQQKQEEFHRIQQAYELIGDEDKRATYDAEVRLNELRKEKLMRASSGPSVEIKTAHYEVRTAAPAGATFGARGPARYEERRPSRSYEEDRRHESTKYDTYEAYPKRSSPRSSREKEPTVRTTKVSSDRTRADHKKTRDREERRDRYGKFVSVEEDTSSSADEKARYETEYRRRAEEEQAKKEAAEARRRAEDRRSYEEPRRHRSDERVGTENDRVRKLADHTNEAIHYISRSKGVETDRPSPVRHVSSREVRAEQESRSRRDRPESAPRRSSARPKESSYTATSARESHRDRKGIPEIVDWEKEERKVPSFKHSSSSPAEINVPPRERVMPQRSYTEAPVREHRRTDTSPTPPFRRTESMPINSSSYPASSSRRREATSRPSGLRTSETVPNMPEVFPSVPPASSSTRKVYHYPSPSGGVSLTPEDVNVTNGHRTILREPERHRARSPSPLSKPPMGANRVVPVVAPAPPRVTPFTQPPPLSRSATTVSPSRGQERGRPKLYREFSASDRKASYSPESVSYTPQYGPEDIRWAGPRGRTSDRDYAPKPTLGRHATYVY